MGASIFFAGIDMDSKKLLRDIFVLFVFCGLFYLATVAVNMLGKSNTQAAEVDLGFSADRIEADRYYNGDDFEEAIPYLERLVEDDKYNSHAWFRLGKSYARVLMQNSKPTLANNFTPLTEEQINEMAAKGIKALNVSVEYPRYKGLSYKNLSFVYAVKKDREMTLDCLRASIKARGFARTSQLRIYGVFSFLYDDDEYLQLERYFYRWWWRNRNAIERRRKAAEDSGAT